MTDTATARTGKTLSLSDLLKREKLLSGRPNSLTNGLLAEVPAKPMAYCQAGHLLHQMWVERDGAWQWLPEVGCSQCDAEAADRRYKAERIANAMRAYKLDTGEYANMRLECYVPAHPSQQRALVAVGKVLDCWRADNWAQGLLLWSNGCGVGKTHLAVSLAVKVAMSGRSIAVWTMPAYLDALRDSYGDGSGNSADRIQRSVLAPDLLVLDDLGAERAKDADWYQSVVYAIAETRWNAHKATVVTSNLSPEQLEARIGQRSWSRLYGMVAPLIVEVGGKDHRMQRRVGKP